MGNALIIKPKNIHDDLLKAIENVYAKAKEYDSSKKYDDELLLVLFDNVLGVNIHILPEVYNFYKDDIHKVVEDAKARLNIEIDVHCTNLFDTHVGASEILIFPKYI